MSFAILVTLWGVVGDGGGCWGGGGWGVGGGGGGGGLKPLLALHPCTCHRLKMRYVMLFIIQPKYLNFISWNCNCLYLHVLTHSVSYM